MFVRVLGRLSLFLGVAFAACAPTSPATHAGRVDVRASLEGTDGGPPALEANRFRLKSSACQGYDMAPALVGNLDERALLDHLAAAKLQVKVQRARADLIYIDVLDADTVQPVRLRLAVLKSREAAGRELHEAIMQHGRGSFGFHRANLAVLAPVAPMSDALAFTLRTQLACWGVLTMAGPDEDFVVAGGYAEP